MLAVSQGAAPLPRHGGCHAHHVQHAVARAHLHTPRLVSTQQQLHARGGARLTSATAAATRQKRPDLPTPARQWTTTGRFRERCWACWPRHSDTNDRKPLGDAGNELHTQSNANGIYHATPRGLSHKKIKHVTATERVIKI